MRVLVCGGRNFKDRARAYAELDRLCEANADLVLIIGGANGADSLARDWYFRRFDQIAWRNLLVFPAEWKKHGKGAGPIRNQAMIDQGHPDLVIALPGGKGTADMVARARKAGLQVIEVPA